MKNVKIVAIAMLLIGAVVGAGVAWQYRQSEVDEEFLRGIAYQQALTPVAITPAAMDFEATAGTFDHTATVDADGSVAADVTVTDTLELENEEDVGGITARGMYLTLWNPVTNRDGLDENLETDYTDIFVTVNGVNRRLFVDGDYVGKGTTAPGVYIGDMLPQDAQDITISIQLLACSAGEYPDGATLTSTIYLYQPSAGYSDSLSFTVTT